MAKWDDPAEWYDAMNPWGPPDEFYLGLVMAAGSVLDVGCGTGRLLHRAREAGHGGRLRGLDPDPAMLAQARTRPDIDWVLADASAAAAGQQDGFDLAVMTGHAFQVLISDGEVRSALLAIRAALAAGGRFAFDTRHPQARAWDQWNASHEVTNPDGGQVRVSYQVLGVDGDVVRLTETLSGRWWDRPQVGHGALRFIGAESITGFLSEAGFAIERQYGDWDGGPVTDTSAEIITIARAAD